jgi:hypothetical protein
MLGKQKLLKGMHELFSALKGIKKAVESKFPVI